MLWFMDLLLNNFLVLVLFVLGILVGGYAIVSLVTKKDYVKGGILSGLTALIFGAAIWVKKSNKTDYEKQIEEIDEKIEDKKEELKEIDKEMEENKKQAEELKKKEEEIVEKLTEKLDKAKNIKPIEVKTDEDVLDAFSSMANRSKRDNSDNA